MIWNWPYCRSPQRPAFSGMLGGSEPIRSDMTVRTCAHWSSHGVKHGIPSSFRCLWLIRSPEEGALPSKMACCVFYEGPRQLPPTFQMMHSTQQRPMDWEAGFHGDVLQLCWYSPQKGKKLPQCSACAHIQTRPHTHSSQLHKLAIYSKKYKVIERGNWSLKNKDTIGGCFAGNRLFFFFFFLSFCKLSIMCLAKDERRLPFCLHPGLRQMGLLQRSLYPSGQDFSEGWRAWPGEELKPNPITPPCREPGRRRDHFPE